jgi:predicted DNA repair protein MutK
MEQSMLSAGLIALPDDSTPLLDTVARKRIVAIKKTAGLMGHEQALAANQLARTCVS